MDKTREGGENETLSAVLKSKHALQGGKDD